MSLDAPPLIEYAPPVSARRQLFRSWAPRVALVALVASTYFWVPPLWDRVQTLYWQRQCLTYLAPPDAVAVDAAFARGGWQAFNGPTRVPAEWTRLYGRVSAPGFISRGPAFLHERRFPGGARALVAVDVVGGGLSSETGAADLTFHVRVFRVPGGARRATATKDQLHRVRLRGAEPS